MIIENVMFYLTWDYFWLWHQSNKSAKNISF